MEEREKKRKSGHRIPASFKVGAVALAFIIIGYQTALFVRSASVARLVSHKDAPDTVFVIDEDLARRILAYGGSVPGNGFEAHDGLDGAGSHDGVSYSRAALGDGLGVPDRMDGAGSHDGVSYSRAALGDAGGMGTVPEAGGLSEPDISGTARQAGAKIVIRKNASHGQEAERLVAKAVPRMIESFDFDPNTVSVRDLQRLGFSEKQALSIDNYRQKGGRYRRASDFARSYVVADSVFKRLEPFIRIPKIDINAADSAALDALPGIGPYFASKIVSYRNELHGYSFPEQLMDIYNFDKEKYDGLKDLISVGLHAPYPLWSLTEEELRKHPYIGSYAAHGIIVYRDNNPRELWTVEGLLKAGILKPELGQKLARCLVE